MQSKYGHHIVGDMALSDAIYQIQWGDFVGEPLDECTHQLVIELITLMEEYDLLRIAVMHSGMKIMLSRPQYNQPTRVSFTPSE